MVHSMYKNTTKLVSLDIFSISIWVLFLNQLLWTIVFWSFTWSACIFNTIRGDDVIRIKDTLMKLNYLERSLFYVVQWTLWLFYLKLKNKSKIRESTIVLLLHTILYKNKITNKI